METTWYTRFDFPGTIKGSVFLAWRPIPMGTRILVEKPMMMVPLANQTESEGTTPEGPSRRSLKRRAGPDDFNAEPVDTKPKETNLSDYKALIAACTPQERQVLTTLPKPRNINNTPNLVTLVVANLLPTDSNMAGGLFPEMCRINHSCNNNAFRAWNSTIEAYTLHALTDIDAGEEITIAYLSTPDANSRSRARFLMKSFGFVCRCWLCTMPAPDREKMDYLFDGFGRLSNIGKRESDTGGAVDKLERSLRRLRHLRQKVNLIEEMGLHDVRLIDPFGAALMVLNSHGDAARARVFATRITRMFTIRLGIDHPATARAECQENNITKHQPHGLLSKAWKTGEDDVPGDLGAKEFEDWLWRQDMQSKGQVAALGTNRPFFPSFAQLPNKKDMDPVFYMWTGSEKLGRRRHWCFLAEITGEDVVHGEKLILADDGDGEEVHLAVDWEIAGGGEHDTRTVAILYAEQEWLHPQIWGIRVTDPRVIKIFDVSLQALQDASEHAQKRPKETDGLKRCHMCNKKGASLPCEGCPYFWYCDKDCRIDAWNDGGHKKHCKILGDADLQGMLALDWDDWKKDVEFPMRVVEVQDKEEAGR